MVRPTTGRPWRWSMAATTELSTPPDIATAIGATAFGGSGMYHDRGDFSQVRRGLCDSFDQRVNLLGRVVAAQRKSETPAGLRAREPNGQQDVRRLDGAARASGSAGDGKSLEVEGDNHRLAFNTIEGDTGCIWNARRGRGVDVNAWDAGEDALLQAVAQRSKARALRLQVLGYPRRGAPEAGCARNIFGAGSTIALMMAAIQNRLQRRSLPDIKSANAFGSLNFMTANRIEIDAELADVDWNFPRRLHAVAVHGDARRASDLRNLGHRLDRAQLIIRVHHRDKNRVRAQRAADVVRIDHAISANGNIGSLHALAFQLSARIQNSRVLNGGGDNVLAWKRMMPDGAENGKIVGLCAAAGEHDLGELATGERSGLAAGLLELLLRHLAIMMDTGGVSVNFEKHWAHGVENLVRHRGCRVVIEVKALHRGSVSL